MCKSAEGTSKHNYTIYIREDNLVGNAHENPANYDLLSAVMICLGDEDDGNYDGVLKLLDVLLANDIVPSEKKKVLTEDFDIAMSNELEMEVEHMCNLSQGVAEKAMQKGMQQGLQQSLTESIRNLMDSLKLDFEGAASALKIPESEYDKYRKLLEKKS